VAITIDTYSYVLPAADAETAHTLAKLILGSSSPRAGTRVSADDTSPNDYAGSPNS
jgi:hypothetical protein